MRLKSTQIMWGCLITWLQSADLGPFSSYKRHIKNTVDVSVSSKTLRRIRTQKNIAKNLEISLWYSNEFQFPISTSFPICLFLNIKVKTDFEVLLTSHIKEHWRTDVSHAIAKFVIKKSVLLNQNFQYSSEIIHT